MDRKTWLTILPLLALFLVQPPTASALVLGQVDDFEDGTTDNWTVGLLGQPHPAPPANISSGGPEGVGDNYLLMTSFGGVGPGSKLAALNLAQWAGDYPGAGLDSLRMDLRNFGATDLEIRLLLSDPIGGPPSNAVFSSNSIHLAPGSGWTTVFFPLMPGALTTLVGDLNWDLSNVTELRIYHSAAPGFPGEAISAQLGVDNIRALGTAPVPEPSTWLLLGSGLASLFFMRRRG